MRLRKNMKRTAAAALALSMAVSTAAVPASAGYSIDMSDAKITGDVEIKQEADSTGKATITISVGGEDKTTEFSDGKEDDKITITGDNTKSAATTTAAADAAEDNTKAPETTVTENKDGTVISYPVVRSDDSAYYLGHLFNGKKSKLGCLFSLKSSDYRQPSQNIAIYGHHLSHSDAMFSTLIDYKQESYYAEHSVITLDSIYGRRCYRIFAVLNMKVSDWDPAAASFGSGKAFLQFVNRAKRKALFNTGVEVKENDHILTLITCDRSYSGASGRLIVMAVQE